MMPEINAVIDNLRAIYPNSPSINLTNRRLVGQEHGIHISVYGPTPWLAYNWVVELVIQARGFTRAEIAQLYGYIWRPKTNNQIFIDPTTDGTIPTNDAHFFETFISVLLVVDPEFPDGHNPTVPGEPATSAEIRYQSAPGEEVSTTTLT